MYKAFSLTNQEETVFNNNYINQFPVTAMNYDENLLYLGDELGNLKIWNL